MWQIYCAVPLHATRAKRACIKGLNSFIYNDKNSQLEKLTAYIVMRTLLKIIVTTQYENQNQQSEPYGKSTAVDLHAARAKRARTKCSSNFVVFAKNLSSLRKSSTKLKWLLS